MDLSKFKWQQLPDENPSIRMIIEKSEPLIQLQEDYVALLLKNNKSRETP